jgi:hypothetical protein
MASTSWLNSKNGNDELQTMKLITAGYQQAKVIL